MTINKISGEACRLSIDPDSLNMKTTEDVAPLSGIASQQRALKALEFGLDIRQPRFHVVAVGDPGSGRTFSARSVAQRVARGRPTPDDVLLLPNPSKPSEPSVLNLPAREGRPLVEAMEALHESLVDGLRGVPEGERFKHARLRVERRAHEQEEELEAVLQQVGEDLELQLNRTEDEVKVSTAEGEEPTPEALQAVAQAVEDFEEQMVEVQEAVDRDLRGELKRIMFESVRSCFESVTKTYEGSEAISEFLTAVEKLVNREIRHLVDDAGEDAG